MKLKYLLAITLVLLTASISAVENQGEFSGIELMHECEAAVSFNVNNSSKLPPLEFVQATIQTYRCISFVTGIVQGNLASVMAIYGKKSSREIPDKSIRTKMYCLPDNGISTDQAIRVILKFLENNPELLNMPAGQLAYIALFKAFPCD